MAIRLRFVFVAVVFHFCRGEEEVMPWNHHVYTGRHLDDYITASKYGPPNVSVNALFVMYTPRCQQDVEALERIDLPPEKFLVYAKHDYKTFPKAVWYEFDERDDLEHRYNPEDCLKILFFHHGATVHTPDVFEESSGDTLANWIWDKLKIQFAIANHRQEDIKLFINAGRDDPEKPPLILRPGQREGFHTYLSHIVYVQSGTDDQLLFIQVVDVDFPKEIVITDDIHPSSKSSLEKERNDVNFQSFKVHNFHREISYYYLLCLNQVLSLPRFTDKGFKKTKIPEELYKDILEFYLTRDDLRQNETHNPVGDGLAINYYDSMCTLVQLTEEMIARIADVLLPITEEWANSHLEKTFIYGIREYYKRNVLRNHVDRIDTHVISAILQVHKELDGAKDWPLEIVGMDGLVRQVYLQPGDMLLYESTTLIHGRPTPFQGKVFANIFAHFKPITWDWKIKGDLITNKGEIVRIVNQLYLPNKNNVVTASNVKNEL